MSAPLPYIFRWDRQGRKGKPCEVLIWSKAMNSCLVMFADGYTMVTSRNAIRRNREVAASDMSDQTGSEKSDVMSEEKSETL
ncbi:hypothetical protein CN154_15250 [Sinorhizobium meliloti]|uniref:hypothetical protein n=1 Tax=Rhizobium meliloti TaxID=382 RepID=UPI000FDCB145|nr:hypothetical protein [Sinorhizobium meliloti]RVK75457.1 hypothetical protein CN154_15250 [Sinorhizobium meliloti]